MLLQIWYKWETRHKSTFKLDGRGAPSLPLNQRTMIIGEQRFQCLNDTGADRMVPQKGRGSSSWDLITGPPNTGVGRRSMSQEMASSITWVGLDRDKENLGL